MRGKSVVARCPCRLFVIRHHCTAPLTKIEFEAFSGQVVEIVVGREYYKRIVFLSQIFCSRWFDVRPIFTRYMVGDKVHDHSHACTMCALDQIVEFCHSVGNVRSQFGRYVIIVSDSVRRSCLPLDDFGMAGKNTGIAIIRLSCLLKHTYIPYMRSAEAPNHFQCLRTEALHLTTAVFHRVASRLSCLASVVKETW